MHRMLRDDEATAETGGNSLNQPPAAAPQPPAAVPPAAKIVSTGTVFEGQAEMLAEIDRLKKLTTGNQETIRQREIKIAELEDMVRTLKQSQGVVTGTPVPDKESSWTLFE
jgi:hypothetical protein